MSCPTSVTPYTVSPSARVASAALASGTYSVSMPSRAAVSAMGSTPVTGRSAPERLSSPKNAAALGQGRYLLRRGQNAQQDGQVIHRALLPHPRRSQIDRDAADGELGPAVLHRRPNALPRLLHRRVRQAHHVEPRQSAGQKALHRHLIAGDARQAQRPYRHHHGQRPLYTNFIAPYILPQNFRREQPLFPKKSPAFCAECMNLSRRRENFCAWR